MELNQPKPPKLAKWLLSLSVAWKFKDEAYNDLDELFEIRVANWGESYARRLYWQDVWSIWIRRSWFEEFDFTHLNTFSMFKNYFKISLRNLKNQKAFSFINIFGLAIGLAFCSLIFLYVQDELTYDSMHQQKESIYRVELTFFDELGNDLYEVVNGSIPLGPTLKEEIPGVKHFSRFFFRNHYTKSDGDATRERVAYADSEVFEMFTFPVLAGNSSDLLPNTNSVVITHEIAIKYFGMEPALGKTLRIRKNEFYEDYEVTGVVQNMPSNSTINFNILLHIEGDAFYVPRFKDRFDMNLYRTYVLLEPNVEPNILDEPLNEYTDKYHSSYQQVIRDRNGWDASVRPFAYRLNPLPEIHLNSSSDPMYSYILSGIGLAILLIACINFMTLSIGRSSKRSKEIGMRKVIGAHRYQLMIQFWGEAFLICTFSLIIGVFIAIAFLPVFNELAGKDLAFNYLENWRIWGAMLGFIVVTGFIAGSYPALLLSNIKLIHSLKGKLKLSGSNLFSKSLVTLQFALSVFLIVSTLVMNGQLKFIQNQDLGFDKEHVVIIPLNRIDGLKLADQMRNTIGNNTAIVDISASGTTMGFEGSVGYGVEHNGIIENINVFTVESNYIDFLGLEIVQGRNFNPNLASDSLESVIVNETLVEKFELTDPIGSEIPGLTRGENTHGGAIIVGVVKDHIFAALYQEITPAMLTMNPAWGHGNLMIRIQPTNIQESIAIIENQWKLLVAEVPFEYSFLEEDLYEVYVEDERWSNIVNYSSIFAILIACLGLFGLVTLSVTSRIKEVGIRKVLGASLTQISGLFAKDFVKLVFLGVLIASPIAYFVMNHWLENFAFRISINALHFTVATLLVLFIALATISVQTIRAGLTNPAQTLSNE